MNAEAQKRALATLRKAASSVSTDMGMMKRIQLQLKQLVEYSAEMAEIGFPAQSRD